jgi:hypothetical protein
MTITETLSKVEDMLSLLGHQKNNDLKYFFKTTNMKTTVATDQIDHLIEAVNDRHMRTASVYLEDMSTKSLDELVHQMNIRLDYLVDTITSLRRKIIECKDDIKKKMDSTALLDKLIEKEYLMMRDKYSSLLRSSYELASQTMEQKETLHRESLTKYLSDLNDLKTAYHRIEEPVGTTNNLYDEHPHHSSSYRSGSSLAVNHLRSSIIGRRSSVSGKTIARENNELTLTTMQEKLDAFNENLIKRSVEAYDKRIKAYPVRRLAEKRQLFEWKKKQVEGMDAEVISSLRSQEMVYEEVIEKLIYQAQQLNDLYDHMHVQMWQLEEERRMLIADSYLDGKFLSKSSMIEDKATKISRSFRIGSQIKALAKLAEMNSSDIKHILLVLASSAKSRIK